MRRPKFTIKATVALASMVLVVAVAAGIVIYADSDAPTGSGQVRHAYGLYKSSPSTLTDSQSDALRLTSAGLLRVSTEGSSVADTELPAAAALADNAANPTAPIAGAALLAWDTATWDRVQIGAGTEAAALRVTVATDSTGVVSVDDNGAALTVDWAGTAPPIGAGLEATALRVTLATDSTGVVSVDDNAASLTVDSTQLPAALGAGAEAGAMLVTIATDSTGLVSVDDNAGALTVDWAGTAPPIGAGLEATALRVTLATDSTGVVSVDDNGAALTVDSTQLPAALGAGAEAGALLVTIANDSTGVVSVDDNAGALTVDWAGTAPPIGAGLEATALRVTLATDSTGVVSVDDNAGSLTVDHAALTVLGTAASVDLNSAIAADVDAAVAADANLRLVGWSCYETAAATASFMLVNGPTGATATKVAAQTLAASGSASVWYGPEGVPCPLGISIDHLTGTVTVIIYYKILP